MQDLKVSVENPIDFVIPPSSKFFDDAYKTTGDRFARSMTGTSLVGLGYYIFRLGNS